MRAFLTSEGSFCVFGGKSPNLYALGKEKEPEPEKKMQEQGTQESMVGRNSCLPCSCPALAKAIPAHKPTGWYLLHGQLAICTPENAPCSFSLDTQKYTTSSEV